MIIIFHPKRTGGALLLLLLRLIRLGKQRLRQRNFRPLTQTKLTPRSMIHHDFLTILFISLREGHDAILPTESLNATGKMRKRRIVALAVILDASSSAPTASSHADETAIFGISCGAPLGEEVVAVVVESLTGVGAHGIGDDGNGNSNVTKAQLTMKIKKKKAKICEVCRLSKVPYSLATTRSKTTLLLPNNSTKLLKPFTMPWCDVQ